MAERRMFAKSIVFSDAFLDMPLSARCLYFTLGMVADDDGFVGNPKSILRQCGATNDDMNILLLKRYVLSFEKSGVLVIKHWRMNNYLQNDRTKKTTYLEELDTLKIDERGAYTEKEKSLKPNEIKCIQNVYIEEDSIDKSRIDKDSIVKNNNISLPKGKDKSTDVDKVIEAYSSICVSYPKLSVVSDKRKKAIKARLRKYTLEQIITAFKLAESSDFMKGNNGRNWRATFDWIMNDTNLPKILEGNYNNKKDCEKIKSIKERELDLRERELEYRQNQKTNKEKSDEAFKSLVRSIENDNTRNKDPVKGIENHDTSS